MARGRKKQRQADGPEETALHRRMGLLLFLLALVLRLLFWQATPDAGWPHSAHYKGDAPTWVDYARAIHSGEEFELELPLRPPGAAYLLAAVWDGSGPLTSAQLVWCLLGAFTIVLVYASVLRCFGFGVATVTALACAVSHGLMVLSTSLNNETPYLFLVVLTIWLWPRLGERRSTWWLWGAVHGLACLVRVEHVLVFALCWLWRAGAGHLAGPLRSCLAFALVLAPWHVEAWHSLHQFNTVPPEERTEAVSRSEQAQIQLEQALTEIRWTDEADAVRRDFPAFARRAAANFVAATVASRAPPGPAPIVGVDDLELLDQAFGYRPEPLPSHPFVTFYGGLNFYLAHNPQAEAGFSRAALDSPPPLDGGPYPPMLVRGLPPHDLSFTYPPHLRMVNHGYAMGWRHIAENPGTTWRRSVERLRIFWSGVALGIGGYDLPLGTDGLRRRADLAVPLASEVASYWRGLYFVLACAGLFLAWRSGVTRRDALVPWLALGGTKLLVGVAFFGYARHGATTIPVVVLLAVLSVHLISSSEDRSKERPTSRAEARGLLRLAAAAALILVAVETVRWWRPPEMRLDERIVGAADPWPVDEHEDRQLGVTP